VVSGLVLAAPLILFLQCTSNIFPSIWLRQALLRRGMSAAQVGAIPGAKNSISGLVEAAAWVMVIVALFGWRKAKSAPSD
jgi:hypothetical protein